MKRSSSSASIFVFRIQRAVFRSRTIGKRAIVNNRPSLDLDSGNQAHVRSLDGIRGVAILAVLIVHYGDLSQSHSALLRVIGVAKNAGWMGVDIFFALSGFLITGILCNTEHKPHAALNFYARRALRLFPLFYGVWAGIALYAWLAHLPWRGEYWAYLLYAGNFAAIKSGSIGILKIGHFWSLAIEEQFYLIWPFVLWKLHGSRRINAILVGALLLSFLFKLVLIAKHVDPWVAYYMLPTHIESIAMGSFLAIGLRGNVKERIVACSRVLLPVSAAAILLLGLIEHGLSQLDPVVQLCFPLLGLLGCCLIVRSLDQASLTARVMTNPVLRFYGRYSYGLYIYNLLFQDILRNYVYQPMGRLIHSQLFLKVSYLFACFVILTLVSVASFHLYESPFLKLKRKFRSQPAEFCRSSIALGEVTAHQPAS